MSILKHILVVGGSGNLGKAVVSKLAQTHRVSNVDFDENPEAQTNIMAKSGNEIAQMIRQHHGINFPGFDATIVTAGGWVGGSIADADYLEKYQKMMNSNLIPAITATNLMAKFQNHNSTRNNLLIFFGAAAVFKEPQPSMLAYSLAKTGVHSLALNAAKHFTFEKLSVLTLLPQVIDTPQNRYEMPNANFSTWAQPIDIASVIAGWTRGLNVPASGSFIILKTKKQGLSL